MNPPFLRVGIVGLGLVGGSIALGLRRAWPQIEIVGVDRPDVSAAAQEKGVIGGTRPRVEDLEECELVVLATPVPEIAELVSAAGRARLRAVVTDVGSTKRHILAAARAGAVRFVGGHPIAGAAHAGFEHARADLFDRREWLLVPGSADEADLRDVERIVQGLGASPRVVDADTHDRVMVYVSHLPQLLASTLMTTAGAAVGKDGLASAGPGFADMTRLASSQAEMWRGILATNADYLSEAVNAFVAALPATNETLADPQRIDALFRDANRWSTRT